MTGRNELNEKELEMVCGGTFTPNCYDESRYNDSGVRTDYHFWAKDEFFIKDKSGKEVSISCDQANTAVRYMNEHGTQPTYEDVKDNVVYTSDLTKVLPRRVRRGPSFKF